MTQSKPPGRWPPGWLRFRIDITAEHDDGWKATVYDCFEGSLEVPCASVSSSSIETVLAQARRYVLGYAIHVSEPDSDKEGAG